MVIWRGVEEELGHMELEGESVYGTLEEMSCFAGKRLYGLVDELGHMGLTVRSSYGTGT